MSTQLKSLKGKIEEPSSISDKSNYFDAELDLNRFYGGIERGISLQMGFYNELGRYNHIQLDDKNIIELKSLLNEYF
jgi:hypothetical protein